MTQALINGRILTDKGFVDDHAVIISGDAIVGVVASREAPRDAVCYDLAGGLLLPGFIDVQVNGGGGILFGENPTPAAIAKIAEAHRCFGTTGILPTIISSDLDQIAAAIAAVDSAMQMNVPGVLGIHIEGPFLSAEKRGIHDASKFRTLDERAVELLRSLRRGKTVVTLAPEETTSECIHRLANAGVIVSAGHTNATYDEACDAIANGLRGFTHLFNAMSPMTAREPGVTGAALDNRDCWCGIIVDGRHVDPAMLRIAYRCKGPERLMLVTDAMPSVGTTQKRFRLQGREILVDGVSCIAPDGTLAGTNLDMMTAIHNAVKELDVDLVTAVAMASRNPAAFLGLDKITGRIAPGYRADLVLASRDRSIQRTWVSGISAETAVS